MIFPNNTNSNNKMTSLTLIVITILTTCDGKKDCVVANRIREKKRTPV